MDRTDRRIVAELEQDARLSFADLAERVGLSISPCWTRVQALERAGVIRGYHARLDPAALGLAVQCFIQVMIRFGNHEAFEEAVLAHPAVLECHTTAGEGDYVLRVYARSVEHLDQLLRKEITKLPGVERSSTTICLKTTKSNGPLSALMAPSSAAGA